MKFRWSITVASSMVAALALTACSGGDAGTDSGETLTLGAISAPTTLDPSGSEWGNRSPYYQAVFDTLLLATPEGELEPFLAESWSYNDDSTVLTLDLRDDVEFSDGSALTAEVVAQNLLRYKDGTSPNAGTFAGVQSVEATDTTTVVVTLSAPDPAFLDYLSRDAGLIASGESLDDADLATAPVGSGPYVLDIANTVIGSSYRYTRNPDYWNPELQHYDTVVINVLEDPTTAVNAILAGEVDGVRLGNNDALDQIEGAGWTVLGNELDFIGLLLLDRDGTMAPALADVRVRQALNYAFDRESLLERLQAGYGTVTTQVFPETSAAFDPELDAYYDYDPERARELLAEAGYGDGFTLAMPSIAAAGAATYALIEQQLNDVGIQVEYTDPGTNFIADLLAPKFPAAYMALEQNPDWQLIQFMIAPESTFNPFANEDPQVSELMEEIQYGDLETQASSAAELNRYLVEQAWFAPFYRSQGSFAVDASTEVVVTPSNIYPSVYDFRPVD